MKLNMQTLEEMKIQPVGSSEIISLGDNESYRTYFSGIWQPDEGYRECYWPGFWLEE
ncbi:MAG: hypothetical protein IK055_06555 [Lachnospiraceae bacterium]|nr:hypothetical protein [Lachnospiraceae bacterium]